MRSKVIGALLVATLALAGCGSSSKTTAVPPSPTTAPVAHPTHIVSLSPTATEMLFAIGAGPQVKAVDDQSDYPPNAPRTKLSGYQPNVEAIANESPDLVVLPDASIQEKLQQLGIKALVEPAAKTLDDTYAQIGALGTATGHATEANTLIAKMKQQIDALAPLAAASNGSTHTYYYEVDNTYYTATSKTFIGALFARLGLHNIADGAKGASDYPQLSAEYIIQKNPDFIFLADTKCCQQSAASVAARPGWNTLKAVTQHHVIALDDDIASRWGPRVVDLLRTIVGAVNG